MSIKKLPVAGAIRIIKEAYGKRALEQKFTLPNGEVIDLFLYEGIKDSSLVVPITREGKIIAIRNFRYGANKIIMEFPGGTSDATINHENVAKEELLNETGYRADYLIQLSDGIWFEPASVRARFVPFVALGCVYEGKTHHDRGEFMETVVVSRDEWLTMICRGDVIDAKTIAATLLAFSYLERHQY